VRVLLVGGAKKELQAYLTFHLQPLLIIESMDSVLLVSIAMMVKLLNHASQELTILVLDPLLALLACLVLMEVTVKDLH
jgi:hypothetical protein